MPRSPERGRGLNEYFRRFKAAVWRRGGAVPHAYGYNPARWFGIADDIRRGDDRYGWDAAGMDERAVEYPWIFHRARALMPLSRVLDAGSVMNHDRILRLWRAYALPPLSIVTLAHEGRAFVSNDVRYEFADLRQLPYRDDWFPLVLSISTIEHVGMDNTRYGTSVPVVSRPADEGRRALAEIRRVLTPGGTLLLSVPFGRRSNRKWFRVFDENDLLELLNDDGWANRDVRIFRATRDGWRPSALADALELGYNDPSAGPEGQTAPGWVAGAEGVALVELRKAG